MPGIRDVTPELGKRILHYASFPQRSVTLRNMVAFGDSDPCPARLFRSSYFLREELPVRLAHRVSELDRLPHQLSDMPSIKLVKGWYATSFQELTQLPPYTLRLPVKIRVPSGGAGWNSSYGSLDVPDEALPSNVEELNSQLVDLLEQIKKRHDPVVPMVAKGVTEWKERLGKSVITDDVQAFLDRFYLSRIGIRFLIGQHIALVRSSGNMKDYVGIICKHTVVSEVAQTAIDNARDISRMHYGLFDSPKVELICDPKLTVMYVPSHLHHILFELLKNSLRATIETHGVDADSYPPVKVIVAAGTEDLTIKVSDEGGGIPRSGVSRIWTYLYTTAQAPLMDTEETAGDFKAPLAGFGYGLPISRLYARYFGGDLKLISMEGYGTDAYIHLSRLSDGQEPLP